MPTVSACPDARILEQFLLGRMSAPDSDRLEEHIARCPRCAATLGSLRAEDPLVVAMRQARTPDDTPREDLVAAMIPWLKRLRVRDGTRTLGGSPRPDETHGPPDTGSILDFLAPPQQPGEMGRLGAYRVLQVLGSGGMGVVFVADDPRLKRQIALKVIKPELLLRPDAHERFLREAQAIAAVEHENIVAIHQVDEDRGVPFLAMPLLRGESLEDRLRRANGPLPFDEILQIGREIAAGLAAAHDRGLIHRDIKPANVFLEGVRGQGSGVSEDTPTQSAGEAPSSLTPGPWPLTPIRVKLLDFGLARAVKGEEVDPAQEGSILGTPAYMAPEQARGMLADARADLFSLGCVLYRMATGRPPFQGADMIAVLLSVVTDQPPAPREINPELPAVLNDLIVGLMAKRTEERPASAHAVVEAIQAIEQARAEAARPKPSRRRWLIASAVCVLSAAGLTAWLLPAREKPVPPEEPVAVTFDLDEPDQRLTLQRGEEEQAIDLKTERTYRLLPGEYAVRPTVAKEGRRLLPERILVKPGEAREFAFRLVGEIRQNKWHSPYSVLSVALSPQPGKLLALSVDSSSRSVSVWNAATDEDPKFLESSEGPLRCVAISSDGKLAAAGVAGKGGKGPNGPILLWDLEKMGPAKRLPGHESWVTAVAFTPDSKRLLSGGADGSVFLWDLLMGERIVLEGHSRDGVNSVAFSPDGRQALTAGGDRVLILWDAQKGKLLKKLEGHTDRVRSVAFAPSGSEAASASDDGTLRVWDLKTGKSREIAGHQKAVNSVAWSPDGKRLLSGSDDRTLRLWNVETGQEEHRFEGHRDVVHGVAFSSDGRRVLSGSKDSTVRLWELPK